MIGNLCGDPYRVFGEDKSKVVLFCLDGGVRPRDGEALGRHCQSDLVDGRGK